MILRIFTIWACFIPVAIANGFLREKGLTPLMGKRLALPFSGISGAFLFFCLTYLTISWLGTLKPHHYWLIGLAWLALTVLFECGFGRTVAHQSWPELLCAYDPTTGNLWILVLISIVLSPVIAANLRGYLR